MRKLFLLTFSILLVYSCRTKQETGPEVDFSALGFEVKELTQRSRINSKAQALLKDWPEYNAFEGSFDALYTVENNEDLLLVMEDLVEQQNLLAASDYPDEFDIPQIKSRQRVLKTYILKTRAATEYRIKTKDPIEEMIAAYNALRNQFNVTVNYSLDSELNF